nr:hypothetical protein [uncultured Mediterraneibacter sp.]
MIKLIITLLICLVLIFIFSCTISDYDRCYNAREDEGVAAFGCCNGLTGGIRNSEYLQEMCINCPYYIGNQIGGKKID